MKKIVKILITVTFMSINSSVFANETLRGIRNQLWYNGLENKMEVKSVKPRKKNHRHNFELERALVKLASKKLKK